MPIWAWAALFLLSLPVAGLFLFRVRYRLEWDGGKKWSLLFECLFPGWSRAWNFPTEAPARKPSSPQKGGPASFSEFSAPGQAGFLHLPRFFRWDVQRLRRAFFRLLTDAPTWGAFLEAGWRLPRSAFGLLRPQVVCALGHPDSASLSRVAAWWYVAGAFPITNLVTMEFRFQDRRPSARLQVRGGFSAARLMMFFSAAIVAFPWWRLLRRSWYCWRHSDLVGWRALAYARIRRAANS